MQNQNLISKVLRLPYGALIVRYSSENEIHSVTNQVTRRDLVVSTRRGVTLSEMLFTGEIENQRSTTIGYKTLLELLKGKPLKKLLKGIYYPMELRDIIENEVCSAYLLGRLYLITHTEGVPSQLENVNTHKIYKPYEREGRVSFEIPYGEKKEHDYLYIRHISMFNVSKVIFGVCTWNTVEGYVYINERADKSIKRIYGGNNHR